MTVRSDPSSRASKQTRRGASWLAAILVAAPLALFAELLIEKTHHRPLGAVTFASFALVAWFFAEFVSRRILFAGTSWGGGAPRSEKAEQPASKRAGEEVADVDPKATGASTTAARNRAKWRLMARRVAQVTAVLAMLMVVVRAVI